MFKFLKKKEKIYHDVIGAPVKGETIPSAEVNDPTFSKEILGKGIAIKPMEGKVYAPFDGEVAMVFETKHAVTLISEKGTELLIHVGLDTVMLKGKYFKVYVESRTTVKKGDLILEFDMDAIKKAGYELIIPVVICNTDDYKEIICKIVKLVEAGETVMELKK